MRFKIVQVERRSARTNRSCGGQRPLVRHGEAACSARDAPATPPPQFARALHGHGPSAIEQIFWYRLFHAAAWVADDQSRPEPAKTVFDRHGYKGLLPERGPHEIGSGFNVGADNAPK
jgi:hypothetical protein